MDDAMIKGWFSVPIETMLLGYIDDDIYSTSETALFFYLLLNRALALKGKARTGQKLWKDRDVRLSNNLALLMRKSVPWLLLLYIFDTSEYPHMVR